jgi:D-2-hydroxyacid dehydrogenase (NADP+)
MQIHRIGIDESVSTIFPPNELVDALSDLPVEIEVVDGSTDPLDDVQAVVTFDYESSFLSLEWVHSIQAGVDKFPLDRFRERGIALTNSTGIHGDAIGETVAGYVLTLARRLHSHVSNQQHREWSQPAWDEAWTVAGEQACVVGLGSLGRGVVDRLSALGLDVVGVRRTPTPEPGVRCVYRREALREAVSDARFVVLAVPLTDETRHLIDGEVFEAMRNDAYLINVARGGVVDQSALVDALSTDEIAGGALDVFETEPLPESSPLWSMDDVLVSPHCGGFTHDYYRNVASLLCESVDRIESGEDPVNRVV